MKKLTSIMVLLFAVLSSAAEPKSESKLFRVRAGGRAVPVYALKVSPADSLARMKGMDDKKGSASIYEMAAFCTFDIGSSVKVEVQAYEDVRSVKILPSSRGIEAEVNGR